MSGATGDLRISGGYGATNAYGKANFANLHNVPNLKWENINPINDYIQTAMMQAQLDTEKDKLAMLKDAHEYGKQRDVILDAMKEREMQLAENAEKFNQDNVLWGRNNLSADKKAMIDLEREKMANHLKGIGMQVSARNGSRNDDIEDAIAQTHALEYAEYTEKNNGKITVNGMKQYYKSKGYSDRDAEIFTGRFYGNLNKILNPNIQSTMINTPNPGGSDGKTPGSDLNL